MITTDSCAERAFDPQNPSPNGANRTAGETTFEFGRFRMLVRQRQLEADGVPIELGTRAFDLLLALLEADGSLVTKDELRSRVWPGIIVAEENLKVQISALRRALGEDRDLIRTEFGRGYRFTAAVRSAMPGTVCQRPLPRRHRAIQRLFSQWDSRQPAHGWSVGKHPGRRVDPAHITGTASCRYWMSSTLRKGEDT
jgi:DNA-binding winged helix-turn-helix (wHTH) protein